MADATDGPPLATRIAAYSTGEELVRFADPVVVVSPAPHPRAAGRPWYARPAVLVGLVVLGVGLRAAALGGGRCLWIDEAMLALNILDRPVAGLLEPLDWNQGAPVGFLLLVKAAVAAFGGGEAALRLVPFVASVLGLVGCAWLAGRLLPRPAAVLAVALFALSPTLISYAAECKQYAVDAAAAVGLFAAGVSLLQGRHGGWRWAVLAAAGAAAVWVSHPAAFVLGGIGTGLLGGAVLARDRRRFLAACGTAGVWLASFAACYATTLRHLGGNRYLLDYWAGHFLPLPPRGVGDVAWLVDHAFAFFTFPGGLGGGELRAGGLAAALAAVGLYGFWRESRPVAVALAVPALLALLASGLNKYPFAGRLLLFLVPLALVCVARGAGTVAAALWDRAPAAAVALVGLLVAAAAAGAFGEVRRPLRQEQLAPVLADLRGRWQPGDQVYVYYGAVPAFLYYTRDAGFPPDAVTLGGEARESRTGYQDQVAALGGAPRVWLVFSHRHKYEEDVILAYAEGCGRCVESIPAPGAAAYLFDFSARPAR